MSSWHFLGQILHFESGWVFGSGSVIGVNCLARLFVYNVTARSFMLSSYRKGKLHRKKRLVHLSDILALLLFLTSKIDISALFAELVVHRFFFCMSRPEQLLTVLALVPLQSDSPNLSASPLPTLFSSSSSPSPSPPPSPSASIPPPSDYFATYVIGSRLAHPTFLPP